MINVSTQLSTKKENNIRKNNLEDFTSINASGKIAMKLDNDDKIVGVKICKDDQELTLMKKTAKGMRGIKNIEFALKEDHLKSYQKGRKEK